MVLTPWALLLAHPCNNFGGLMGEKVARNFQIDSVKSLWYYMKEGRVNSITPDNDGAQDKSKSMAACHPLAKAIYHVWDFERCMCHGYHLC